MASLPYAPIEMTAVDGTRGVYRHWSVVAYRDLFGALLVEPRWGRCCCVGVGVICLWSVVSDIRSGTSHLAHEEISSSRRTLPLKFWLGVGSKFVGFITAVVIVAIVV